MKKVFNTQFEAENFAKEVKGLVTQSYLPNYNYIDVIWTVEWKEEEE
jgi:hypothetical protein